jgi:sugar phosphate isomerase/epimerase
MTLREFIEFCLDNKVEAVELLDCFWEDEKHSFEIKKYLDEVGMPVSAYSIANDFVNEEEVRAAEIEKVKKGIDMALFLDTSLLRVFSGDVKEGISYDQGREWIIDCFKECAKYAEAKGVTMVLENHGRFAGKSSQVKDIIVAVNSNALKANTDTGNFLLVGENPLEAVMNLKDDIGFVHFKDFKKSDEEQGYMADDGTWFEGTAIGDGDVPLKDIVDFLRSVGYSGYLSIEFEGGGDPIEGTLKSIMTCQRDVLLGK